jgi:cyclopropane-fatty-acyl-phospholipid synthase
MDALASGARHQRPGIFKKALSRLAQSAGIEFDGSRPWDVRVNDERFYREVMLRGSLGLGESYVAGWWDCTALDEFFARVIRADLGARMKTPNKLLLSAFARLTNRQTRSRSRRVGEAHYDLGNDLYRAMLDRRMVYSCAYWRTARDLDEAQEHKLDLICRKLELTPGQRVLDIGCGWGSFARFAAERYGVSVLGITISKEQAELARELCKGLPVEIRLQDYRELRESFDRVVSIGMFEHVGRANYRAFFAVVRRCLVAGGLALVQSIGASRNRTDVDPWIDKYIFPNGEIPSLRRFVMSAERLFNLEDLHNLSTDYEKTLMAWYANFVNAWPALQERYGARFYRLWTYYLLMCAGNFRARGLQLWQAVFAPEHSGSGYRRPLM